MANTNEAPGVGCSQATMLNFVCTGKVVSDWLGKKSSEKAEVDCVRMRVESTKGKNWSKNWAIYRLAGSKEYSGYYIFDH